MKESRINNDTENINDEALTFDDTIAEVIIVSVIGFLGLFRCETIVKRIVCLILLAAKVPRSRISKLVSVSDKTVSFIYDKIVHGNHEDLYTNGFEQSIVDEIEKNKFFSLRQIKEMIRKKYGIDISISGVRRLLQKFGIKRLKSGSLPAKADPVEQRNFYNTILLPLMDKAELGEISLFFMDAGHFVFG